MRCDGLKRVDFEAVLLMGDKSKVHDATVIVASTFNISSSVDTAFFCWRRLQL